jgi:hypothetical protein
VQLLSIIGSAGTLPSRKFAVSLFANRYSLFATRCRSDAPKKFSAALEGASPDAPKIFGSAGALPSRKLVIRYSLFTIRQSPIANHQSLPFPDLPICRFHDLPISSARQEPRPPN